VSDEDGCSVVAVRPLSGAGSGPGASFASSDEWLGPAMSQRLATFARRFVRDAGEAEDIAQEALMRAKEHLHSLRSADRAEAWLFRICRHAAIDHARSRRVRRAVWAPMPADGGPPPVPAPAERPAPPVRLDLRALPSHQRLLVSLHYERGLSHPTLCRMTGLLPSALRVRLFRARGALTAGV